MCGFENTASFQTFKQDITKIKATLDKIKEIRVKKLRDKLEPYKEEFLKDFQQINSFSELINESVLDNLKHTHFLNFKATTDKVHLVHKYNEEKVLSEKINEFTENTRFTFTESSPIDNPWQNNIILNPNNWMSHKRVEIEKVGHSLVFN